MKTDTVFKIFAFVLWMTCAISCSNSNDTPPVINNGVITVTGFSSDIPYLDDVLNVTGTGFSTDTSKIKIEFGSLGGVAGAFVPFAVTPVARFKILTATATKITFAAVNPYQCDLRIPHASGIVIRVTSNGQTALLTDQSIRFLPSGFFQSPYGGPTWYLHPNIKYFIEGRGFTTGCSNKIYFSRCDIENCETLDENLRCQCEIQSQVGFACLREDGYLEFTIPTAYYGVTHDDCSSGNTPAIIQYQAAMIIENSDGKRSIPQWTFVNVCPQ